MSHAPQECEHILSAWTTEERLNEAGERSFVFQRKCFQCPFVQEEAGAIIEPSDVGEFRHIQQVTDEPDD